MKRLQLSNLALLRLAFGWTLLLYSFWLTTQEAHASTVLFADDFNSPLGTNWQLVYDQQSANPQQPCMNRTSPASWIQELGKLKLEINGPVCYMDFSPSNVELRGLSHYRLSL